MIGNIFLDGSIYVRSVTSDDNYAEPVTFDYGCNISQNPLLDLNNFIMSQGYWGWETYSKGLTRNSMCFKLERVLNGKTFLNKELVIYMLKSKESRGFILDVIKNQIKLI